VPKQHNQASTKLTSGAAVAFQSIPPSVVDQLISWTAASEPAPFEKAGWYADVRNDLLGAIMQSEDDANWRFAIFERDRFGSFRKVSDGEDFNTEHDATVRMNKSAQEFLADNSSVQE
jgi:hypothetical protein